jgi:hypothetical protein
MSFGKKQSYFVIKYNNMNKYQNRFIGLYNEKSLHDYKNNIVYFKNPRDAVKLKSFIMKHISIHNESPNLFDYNNQIINKSTDITTYSDFIEYLAISGISDFEYTVDLLESDNKPTIEICSFDPCFLDFLLSINNLGCIECEISTNGKINTVGVEKRICINESKYKQFLEIIYDI